LCDRLRLSTITGDPGSADRATLRAFSTAVLPGLNIVMTVSSESLSGWFVTPPTKRAAGFRHPPANNL
jgi:hypothetical protein